MFQLSPTEAYLIRSGSQGGGNVQLHDSRPSTVAGSNHRLRGGGKFRHGN